MKRGFRGVVSLGVLGLHVPSARCKKHRNAEKVDRVLELTIEDRNLVRKTNAQQVQGVNKRRG